MSLPPFILHNFWLKIFSVILAGLIWFAIESNQSGFNLFSPRLKPRELRSPIRLMLSPNNRSTFNVEPKEVVVKVSGEDSVLKKLSPDNVRAYVRLNDAPDLSGLFHVEVIVPADVTLQEVVPDQVSVQLAGPASK